MLNKQKAIVWLAIHAALPLLIGFFIYKFFRTGSWLHLVAGSRHRLNYANSFIELLANTGPDFCWSYSFASCFNIINLIFFRNKLLSLATVIILLLAEIMQVLVPRYFRFDWIDLFASLLAALISYTLIIKNKHALS